MADIKWSEFPNVGDNATGDEIVGLRSGNNVRFNSPSDQFLLKSEDLGDVPDTNLALKNLGVPSSPPLSFIENVTITNPPPKLVYGSATLGGGFVKLPPAQGVGAINIGQSITITLTQPSQPIQIQNSAGTLLVEIQEGISLDFILGDNSTPEGTWYFGSLFPFMDAATLLMGSSFGIMTVGELFGGTGINVDSSIDGQITLNSTSTLQTDYNNGDGTITVLNNNSKPFAVGNDETNIFGPYGVYISAIRNLSTLPTEYWFQFFEANDSSSTMTQYGAIACFPTDTTAGSVSGFMAMGAAKGDAAGEVLPFLFADGINNQAGSAYPFLISDNVGIVDPSSMFDIIDSTHSKGARPYTIGTLTQRDSISSPANGLAFFNDTYKTIDYYDSTAWQVGLTIDHVLAGTNMTIVQNGDGTITLNSSGGGPGNNSSYAGWSFANGGTSTTFSATNTYVPIEIVVSLNDIISSDFVNEVVNISGNTTPCFRYIGSSSQDFEFNFNLYARGAVVGQKIYKFQVSVQRSGGSIVQTGYVSGDVVLQDLIFPYDISLSGIFQLNTGDRVYISVLNKTDTSSVVIQAGNANILNVDATEQAQIQWNNVSGTSASMSPNNGYVTSNAGLVTLSLPTTCNFGSSITVDGFGAGGWTITQSAGQQCFYEGASTTLGATGTISSTNSKASVTLRCVVQDTTFVVENTTGAITLA